MSAALELRGLSVRLGGRQALSGVDWSVAPGSVAGLVGPNGAGKSTLMRAALGLVPFEGEARLFGADVTSLTARARAERAAWLPQDRRLAWNLPSVEVAALGAPFAGAREARERAQDALARTGATELADRGVLELSGGERARVLLARLLAACAPLMLLDEPAAGLDPAAQLGLMRTLRAEAERGATVVVAMHDLGLAARTCDRVLVLDHGRVAAEGPPREALSPQTLERVFGLNARWIEAEGGPWLAAGLP